MAAKPVKNPPKTPVKEPKPYKPPKETKEIAFERDIPDDFREAWPDLAEIQARKLLHRGRLINRSHWDHWGPDRNIVLPSSFDRVKMVNSMIAKMDSVDPVGYSWAIVQNGQLVDAGGIGDARTASEVDPRPMEADTRMVSASLAKPVCAVAMMKLIEDGVVDLFDHAYPLIEAGFPDAHTTMSTIWIRDLLTHRSGFDGPAKLSAFAGALEQPLAKLPGTGEKYENWNYRFLAHLMEGVMDIPYFQLVADTVFNPMLITSITRENDADAPCLYYGSTSTSGGGTWNDFTSTQVGAYGWFGSAIDWAKFMAFFRYDKVLSKETRLTMLNWSQTYFGFRLWKGQPRGTYYGHVGDLNGNGCFHGCMMGFPDVIDAVLLSNSDHGASPASVLIEAYHDAFD